MIVDAETLTQTMDEIERNQQEYERLARRRSPWALRKQYRLCKANELLFARLGAFHPPFVFEQPDYRGGLFTWWLRR